jgi:AbrB family looped-hinge helix DNA binding protein
MNTITLSSKGQLVIPKSLRESARLAPGDRLLVTLVRGEIRLKRVDAESTATLEQVAGCLARPGRKRLSAEQEKAAIQARLKARLAAS